MFHIYEQEDGSLPSQLEFEEGSPAHSTVRLRPADVLYLQPDKILSELPATSRLARNLNALLKISRVVHSIRDLDELQAQILESLFAIVPAERGAILLDGTNGREFNSTFARHRDSDNERPVRVSRSIAHRVLEQGLAVLGSDVPCSTQLGAVVGRTAAPVA